MIKDHLYKVEWPDFVERGCFGSKVFVALSYQSQDTAALWLRHRPLNKCYPIPQRHQTSVSCFHSFFHCYHFIQVTLSPENHLETYRNQRVHACVYQRSWFRKKLAESNLFILIQRAEMETNLPSPVFSSPKYTMIHKHFCLLVFTNMSNFLLHFQLSSFPVEYHHLHKIQLWIDS